MTVQERTGSAVVKLLEKVWARIRADHPELPDVVIVTGAGLAGDNKWGHFRANGWKVREEGVATSDSMHEMFMAGETLAKGAHQVLQTMLHEAAHTLARVRDQKDTSRQGRWHNQTFLKAAVEMGLEHRGDKADKTHGYAFVTLASATRTKYADLLTELEAEINLVVNLPVWMGGTSSGEDDRGGERIGVRPPAQGGGSSGSAVKATCQCDEPRIIRVSKKVLAAGEVMCGICRENFTHAA